MYYLNYYLTKDNDVIFRFVKNRNAHATQYKLLYTYIFNDYIKKFQLYEDYMLYINRKMNFNSKLNKIIKFIIDL